MLPNWLYGKSKSKLASILGGGGGIPEDYNQVKAQVTQNAEDILLLSDALDDKAALTQISNPNILHNPWFSVNQRDFTTDTGSAQMWPADRWYIIGDNKTVTRASDGMLTIKNEAGTNVYLTQKGPTNKMASLIGKKVTASIMMGDGTIKSGTITFNANERQSYISESNFELYKNNSSGNNILFSFTMPAGELTIKAFKLEIGEVSTLAMDPRPEMATELAKCQRYFIRLKSDTNATSAFLAYGVAITDSQVIFALPLPSQMITKPTISASLLKIERYGATTPTGTPAFTISAIAGNIIRLNVSGVSPISTGAVYSLVLTYQSGAPAGYIDFDAEL